MAASSSIFSAAAICASVRQSVPSPWRHCNVPTRNDSEFFKIPVVYQPGTTFMYTSAASYMLSAILTKVTGETLHDYLKPRFFEPLGIKDEHWDIGPDNINPGGNGLTMKTADLLKLGVLHAQGGMWEGRRGSRRNG